MLPACPARVYRASHLVPLTRYSPSPLFLSNPHTPCRLRLSAVRTGTERQRKRRTERPGYAPAQIHRTAANGRHYSPRGCPPGQQSPAAPARPKTAAARRPGNTPWLLRTTPHPLRRHCFDSLIVPAACGHVYLSLDLGRRCCFSHGGSSVVLTRADSTAGVPC